MSSIEYDNSEWLEGAPYIVIFPLSALTLNVSYKFLIDCILSYAVIQRRFFKNDISEFFGDPGLFNLKVNRREFNELYQKITKKKLTSVITLYAKFKIIYGHEIKVEKIYGKRDARVFMHAKLLRDILYKNALTERQFRLLCAIFSKIGKVRSNPKVIYNKELVLRSQGYVSNLAYDKLKNLGLRKIIPYSNKILRNELTFLKRDEGGRGFFSRIRDGRRYYYSRASDQETLMVDVSEILAKRKETRIELENKRNRDLREMVYRKCMFKISKKL